MLANRVEEDYPCTCITETTKFWDWHESALAHSQAREEELVRALEKINNFDPGRCMGDVACQLEEWVSHAKETIETALSTTISPITTANPQDVMVVALIEEGANVESARKMAAVVEAAIDETDEEIKKAEWEEHGGEFTSNSYRARVRRREAVRTYKESIND
jgi:hypothetical protein